MSRQEIERRYRLVRAAMEERHLDAVLVCGSEYTGFEGAVTYMSGFVIVHRYAYVLLPREGEPTIIQLANSCDVVTSTPERITYRIRRGRPGTLTPGDENSSLDAGNITIVRHCWFADAPMPETVIAACGHAIARPEST